MGSDVQPRSKMVGLQVEMLLHGQCLKLTDSVSCLTMFYYNMPNSCPSPEGRVSKWTHLGWWVCTIFSEDLALPILQLNLNQPSFLNSWQNMFSCMLCQYLVFIMFNSLTNRHIYLLTFLLSFFVYCHLHSLFFFHKYWIGCYSPCSAGWTM